jgi:O-6-methylguanine DNA methyltransferase
MALTKQIKYPDKRLQESFTVKIFDRLILFKCLIKQDKCCKIELEFSQLPVNQDINTPIKSEIISILNSDKNNISNLFDLTCNDRQLMVYKELMEVPYGETRNYSELSIKTGFSSPRYIGNILSKNPLPIVIPCHRIIGKDKTLRGYAFGLEMKQLLLSWEARKK